MNLTIEQMREIVDGAPNEASHFELIKTPIYMQFCGEEWFWFNTNYNEWFLDYPKGITDRFSLSDLRAALADHDRTDHVTDIRNHISPNTRVSEAHVNEAFKLNRLG